MRQGIYDSESLFQALESRLSAVDLALKSKDFEHLLFNPHNAQRIMRFGEFIRAKRESGK